MKAVDVQSILQQEVTRKQFVINIGVAVLAIIGIPAFLKNLNGAFQIAPKSSAPAPDGAYGMSAYSGLPASNAKSAALPARKVIQVQ